MDHPIDNSSNDNSSSKANLNNNNHIKNTSIDNRINSKIIDTGNDSNNDDDPMSLESSTSKNSSFESTSSSYSSSSGSISSIDDRFISNIDKSKVNILSSSSSSSNSNFDVSSSVYKNNNELLYHHHHHNSREDNNRESTSRENNKKRYIQQILSNSSIGLSKSIKERKLKRLKTNNNDENEDINRNNIVTSTNTNNTTNNSVDNTVSGANTNNNGVIHHQSHFQIPPPWMHQMDPLYHIPSFHHDNHPPIHPLVRLPPYMFSHNSGTNPATSIYPKIIGPPTTPYQTPLHHHPSTPQNLNISSMIDPMITLPPYHQHMLQHQHLHQQHHHHYQITPPNKPASISPTTTIGAERFRLTYSKMLQENYYNSRLNRGDNPNIWGAFINSVNNDMYYATGHTFTIGSKNSNFILPSNDQQQNDCQHIICRISSYVSDSSQVIIESYLPDLIKINNKSNNSMRPLKPILLNSMEEIILSCPNGSGGSGDQNMNKDQQQQNISLIFIASCDLVNHMKRNQQQPLNKPTTPNLKRNEMESNSYFLHIYHDIDNNGIKLINSINNNINYHPHQIILEPTQSPKAPLLNTHISPPKSPVNSNDVSNVNIGGNNENSSKNNSNNDSLKSISPFDKDLILELFKKSLINYNDLPYNLNNFPHYLSGETKELLINTGNFFLNYSEFIKYSQQLSAIDNRILLEGQLGSDIYQKLLVKSLAKHFNANLLVIDSNFFDVNKYKNVNYIPTKETKETITNVNNTNNNNVNNTPNYYKTPNNNNSNNNNHFNNNNTTTNNSNGIFGNFKIRNNYGKTALSLDDLELRPHWYQLQAKQTLFESRRRFKNGDKVRFSSIGCTSFIMNFDQSRKTSLLTPPDGLKGEVVVPNDQLNTKVGVKFEKTFVGANNLNGVINENTGYLANSFDLLIDDSESETSLDYFFFSNLLEFTNQLKGPVVIYITDLEKTILSEYNRALFFKEQYSKRIKSLPVLLVTSITSSDICSDSGMKKDKFTSLSGGISSLFGNSTGTNNSITSNNNNNNSNNNNNNNINNAPFVGGNYLPFAPIHSFLSDKYKVDNRNQFNNNIDANGSSSTLSTSFSSHSLSNKMIKVFFKLFPFKISIQPPKDKQQIQEWNALLERDNEDLRLENNKITISKITNKNNLVINDSDLNQIEIFKKQLFNLNQIDNIISWSLLYNFNNKDSSSSNSSSNSTSPSSPNSLSTVPTKSILSSFEVLNDKLLLPIQSIEYGLSLWKNLDYTHSKSKTPLDIKNIETENEFEKRLLSDVITPEEISVRFQDIGALDKVKEVLKELVMLPLQRPELFTRGNLTKPIKGILLFGPPGTGKTMLAKAVANESGAHFLNISMSSISSKWFGEGEKFAKAVFTLASKLSPCVIFIDEVDAVLGKRESKNEHEAMRKIKNEFMTLWDGLKTKENERVLVLAATNRPFDIDEAVLRRMRKLLVDLPDENNRFKILQIILEKEVVSQDFDIRSIAKQTNGYSGSDLKNLSICAAYQPIRELLEQEKTMKTANIKNNNNLRPISNEDFLKALKEIKPSVSESINDIRKWNESFGDGDNKQSNIPSYYI